MISSAILLFSLSAVLGTQYERLGTLDNFIPPGNVIPLKEPSVKSVIECARTCSRHNETCQSFFYINSTTPMCQLHATVWNSTESLNNITGSKYYKIQDVPFHPFRCPTSSLEYTSVTLSDGTLFTYRFDETDNTHADAFTACAADGGHLAQVVTQAKLDMIFQIRNNCLAYSAVWIDGNNLDAIDFYDLDQWHTSTSAVIPSTFWFDGQPNAQTTDHCLYMYLLDNGPNTFADALCTLSTGYSSLCEL